MTEREPAIEIRCPDGPGIIDEICAKDIRDLHIEQMSADGWFMGITASDGSYWQFWFGAKNRKSAVEFRHTEMVPAGWKPGDGLGERSAQQKT